MYRHYTHIIHSYFKHYCPVFEINKYFSVLSLFMTLFCCRSWRTELCKGCCALVCVSVDHDESQRTGAVRGVVMESQYLLEPCGTARTRLTHVSRVDLRCGQMLEPLVPVASPNCTLCALLIAGGGLQNGTTRPLATCV